MKHMMKLGICLVLAATACGSSRTAAVRYPGAPAAFDAAGSDPKAVALAQKVFEAAGGPGNWDKAHQIKWTQEIVQDGKPTSWAQEAWDRWNARFSVRAKNGDKILGASYELYGDTSMAYLESANGYRTALTNDDKKQALDRPRKAFAVDSALMTIQFLLLDPGAKLADKGPSKESDKEYEELEVSFADPARGGITYTVFVDTATNTIHRVDYNSAEGAHFAYNYDGWVTVGGLKFAGTRTNAGVSETIQITEVTVTEPDDRLFVPGVQY